jgi:hypothetical protein
VGIDRSGRAISLNSLSAFRGSTDKDCEKVLDSLEGGAVKQGRLDSLLDGGQDFGLQMCPQGRLLLLQLSDDVHCGAEIVQILHGHI